MSKFDPYTHLRIALNSDGSITRCLQLPKVKANPVAGPDDVVVSKDVTINVETKTWVRIVLPTKLPSKDHNTVARLPIIIYFRHGGWVLFSVDDASIHRECLRFSSRLPSIVVAVNYRHAPENRLPAQYHDAMDAICWVKNQAINPEGEQWLRDYGDFSRCYLYGCGCGGNIVFSAALRSFERDLEPLKIAGLIMNQPLFGGEKRTKSELDHAADDILPLPVLDLMWELVLPKGLDRDHRYCNPMIMGPHRSQICRLPKCLVVGYYTDPTIDRQQEFVTMLATSGANVSAWFDDAGFHAIHLLDPQRAAELVDTIKTFIIGC
ncbi:hypothetical protein F2P56_028253 [Juglans regia]|uniref:Alpha/beta hydrolase fold-3 domain-containing protein n=2 Tax=Juglans regia TaxID=51240 RepID=A0A833UJH5_JUGRE|nr:probable carboxylesterase 9 [Juglans regia]KAF5453345.1 hypothetical protein F2P56_028253 [Juglans regia]